ncbi:MAG: hypothetical protein OEX18_03080 [Candidatus Krumholzibacteria bacterium]|nr:hypothetical protein [Candidatus Krumholzibacteria bacterium]MDH4336242.1 hypothetical protein [Candidatus Krumholzibacteria bacterium]MDH5269719.1 hypothetical protein [Candidatus Krumholzibacteria bacterium]
MKRTLIVPAMVVALAAMAIPGCLEDKVVELVLTGETYADFSQDETTENFVEPAVVDMGQEIRDILNENGYGTDDILEAHVTSASYGVTSFSQAHDWEIGGRIDVTYNGTTETAIFYTAQSVQGALGKKIPAPLEVAAVDLINTALDDFLAGANPVLTFTVVNGSVTPVPSPTDRMIFDWRAWLAVQIIIEETLEDIPDPF